MEGSAGDLATGRVDGPAVAQVLLPMIAWPSLQSAGCIGKSCWIVTATFDPRAADSYS